jgi:hypothetical protein
MLGNMHKQHIKINLLIKFENKLLLNKLKKRFDKKNSNMFDESKYLEAFSEISNYDFDEKKWLVRNFELYKQTLNWPENLPPINRTNLIAGTLRESFNSTYKELLSEFEYEINNEKQTLEIKSTNR